MALIVFSSDRPGYDHTAAQAAVIFRDDAWYWALYEHFSMLWAETGRRLDLYGDAVFDPYMLPIFLKHLQRAREEIAQRPDQYQVKSGRHPIRGDVLHTVARHELVHLIDRLEGVVAAAMADGKLVVALGD